MPGEAKEEILAVYDRYFAELFSFCAYRLYAKDLAEDAASAVFVRMIEQFATLRARSQGEVRNWLYGTASNVVASYLRDSKRRKAIQEALLREKRAALVETGTGNRLDWPVLYESIRALKPKYQAIIVMRFFQGLDTLSIADAMNMRHGTVRVYLLRAISKLKGKLAKQFGEAP